MCHTDFIGWLNESIFLTDGVGNPIAAHDKPCCKSTEFISAKAILKDREPLIGDNVMVIWLDFDKETDRYSTYRIHKLRGAFLDKTSSSKVLNECTTYTHTKHNIQ